MTEGNVGELAAEVLGGARPPGGQRGPSYKRSSPRPHLRRAAIRSSFSGANAGNGIAEWGVQWPATAKSEGWGCRRTTRRALELINCLILKRISASRPSGQWHHDDCWR